MALDVGLPLVAFSALDVLGSDNWVSLLASGLRTASSAICGGRLNPFSSMLLVVFGVGLALAFVSGDAPPCGSPPSSC